MEKLIVMAGPIAAGKSTWCRNYLAEHPDENAIIVNRDLLRESLFGYTKENIAGFYASPNRKRMEDAVTNASYAIINAHLDIGGTVLLDQTNLDVKILDRLFIRYEGDAVLKVIDCTLDESFDRCYARGTAYPASVVLHYYQKYEAMKLAGEFEKYPAYVP